MLSLCMGEASFSRYIGTAFSMPKDKTAASVRKDTQSLPEKPAMSWIKFKLRLRLYKRRLRFYKRTVRFYKLKLRLNFIQDFGRFSAGIGKFPADFRRFFLRARQDFPAGVPFHPQRNIHVCKN